MLQVRNPPLGWPIQRVLPLLLPRSSRRRPLPKVQWRWGQRQLSVMLALQMRERRAERTPRQLGRRAPEGPPQIQALRPGAQMLRRRGRQ